MGSFVSYWFVAFVLILILSILSAGILFACWTSLSPETIEWEITPAGKILLRARNLFAVACGIIFACLVATGSFMESDTSAFFRWCDAHRLSLPAAMIVSFGFSFFSSFQALQSKGDGRRVLLFGALAVAVLSLFGAGYLMVFLGQ
ncbi:MAG: hypothetical protein ABSE36_16265 [Terracidiphilus sp.]